MKIIKRLAFILYPIGVAVILPFLLEKELKAGKIRQLVISEEKPGVIILALGHTTAVSFPVKPEKIVRGSPGKLQVEFLGKDLVITPIAKDPGNLIVYGKSGRHVLLFRVGQATEYDDVVEIVPSAFGSAKALHLLDEAYKPTNVTVRVKREENESTEDHTAEISAGETKLRTNELPELLERYRKIRCERCLLSRTGESVLLSCTGPIRTVKCAGRGIQITIDRGAP